MQLKISVCQYMLFKNTFNENHEICSGAIKNFFCATLDMCAFFAILVLGYSIKQMLDIAN